VCHQAGLSSRFFYESFDSLDALAVEVVEEIALETIASLGGALASDGELPERIRSGIAALVGTLTDDPRKARVAFVEALGSEPVMKRRLEVMRDVAALLVSEFRRIDTSVDDDAFVQLAAFGLVGLVVELMIAWTSGQITRERDALIVDIADLVIANIDGAITVAHRRAGVL
jgi:AcrR family transcriptional regulator